MVKEASFRIRISQSQAPEDMTPRSRPLYLPVPSNCRRPYVPEPLLHRSPAITRRPDDSMPHSGRPSARGPERLPPIEASSFWVNPLSADPGGPSGNPRAAARSRSVAARLVRRRPRRACRGTSVLDHPVRIEGGPADPDGPMGDARAGGSNAAGRLNPEPGQGLLAADQVGASVCGSRRRQLGGLAILKTSAEL